jgi:hypothetical protein
MKKIILLITTFLTAFVLVILGIVGTLSVRSKSETDSQCTIEKIENYEIKDASYNFTKLDGMIKKYEIQVKGLLTFYLDGEKIENNEEHFFHTSDDEFFKNVMEHSDQYGLYEVTVSINNRSNEMMFDVGWILDSERHAVIETDFAVEGISVGAKKDGQFNFVVLTDKPDLSEEQVKNLLISDGLKLTYQTESGADIHNNEIHIK